MAAEPTFATIACQYWDEETDAPYSPRVEDLVCADGREDAEGFLRDHADWLRITHDTAEADARRQYAEHAGAYLAGIFPNARVNPSAFSAACGEELGCYSADIVRLVGQRARRSAKALPPIATLIEWAELEAKRRRRQAKAYEDALRAYHDAVARGAKMVAQMVGDLALHLPAVDADTLAGWWRAVTDYPAGIEPVDKATARKIADLRRLLSSVQRGDENAAAVARSMLDEFPALDRALKAAEADDFGGIADWWQDPAVKAHRAAVERWRAAIANAIAEPVQRPPMPVPVPHGCRRIWHAKFGEGTVAAEDGDRLEVMFDKAGPKLILATFATPIEPVGVAVSAGGSANAKPELSQ
ncbi:hypothetical protein [Falsiroseomonas sp. E2-1-a20]|uniref:hypothetical protein n=1 Tax=Falsiroseomonas sp. E2-1-a20 TaxID=3239300 RepID=UPI003F2D6899